MRKKIKNWLSMLIPLDLLLFLIIGLISWTLYELLKEGSSDLLAMFHIQNGYLQGFLIIVFGIAILWLLYGINFKSSIIKVIKR